MVNLAVAPKGVSRDEYERLLRGLEWINTLLPGTNIWLPACPLCAALTLHRDVHTLWHVDNAYP